MAGHVVQQLFRHRFRESLVGRLGPIPRVAQQTHLVLHLDHDDAAACVHFLDVPHEGGKGAAVGIQVRRAEGGQGIGLLAVLPLRAREAVHVALDPQRRVTGGTVLPACEPQEHQPQIVVFRGVDLRVHQGEIELARFRFQQLPRDGGQYGVEVQRHQLVPDRLHEFETGGGGVTQFSRQHQKWLAVDDHLRGGALLLKMGDGRPGAGVRLGARCR